MLQKNQKKQKKIMLPLKKQIKQDFLLTNVKDNANIFSLIVMEGLIQKIIRINIKCHIVKKFHHLLIRSQPIIVKLQKSDN